MVDMLKDLDRETLERKYRDIENLYLVACENTGIPPYPETLVSDTTTVELEEKAEATTAPSEPASEPSPTPVPTPAPDPFLVTEDEL